MWSHLIGIALVTLAFLLFGRGIVNRENGKNFRPVPVFVLLVAAILFQLLYQETGIVSRFSHLLVDVGIGMIIASLYLVWHKGRSVLFWAPGALALALGSLVNLFLWLVGVAFNTEKPTVTEIEMLIELGPDDKLSEIQPILQKYKANAEQAFPQVTLNEDADLAQYYIVRVPRNWFEALNADLERDRENVDQTDTLHQLNIPELMSAEAQRTETPSRINDPLVQQQWYAQALGYEQVYAWLADHRPVRKAKVAIVDTGVSSEHEDLGTVYEKNNGPGDHDQHSHGSHCAGLAGVATNNGIGTASLNLNGEYLTLTGFPALDGQGRGTDVTVSRAIIDAADAGADVISMSLGGFSPAGAPKAQVDAIRYARKKGAIVVVAAGNSNDDARRYSPANIKGVITVGAVGETLEKAPFSNTNQALKMPIASPGVNILSTVPGSQYAAYNGTSMATPIVAGLVGMMRALNPVLTPEQAWQILHDTGMQGRDDTKVGRLIQPLPALEAAIRQTR
ncbi:MAG: S8 family serine peptidase [Bacteroidia bacterium]|nr:S8 family serine peptidase [Bacteroidia bacterium]